MTNVTPQFRTVAGHFLRHKVPVAGIDEESQTIQLTLPLTIGRTFTRFTVSPDGRYVGVVAEVITEVPGPDRFRIAEAIARVNWVTAFGGFQLDFADGEATYRWTALLGTSLEDLDELLPAMLAAVFNALEAHGPALQRVSTGALAPEAVLES